MEDKKLYTKYEKRREEELIKIVEILGECFQTFSRNRSEVELNRANCICETNKELIKSMSENGKNKILQDLVKHNCNNLNRNKFNENFCKSLSIISIIGVAIFHIKYTCTNK